MHKLIVLLILTVSVAGANAQSVTIVNDTILKKGKPVMLIRTTERNGQKVYSISNFNKKPQASIYFIERDSDLQCSAMFPQYMLRYDVYYPKIDITVLLESYIKNKIIVKDHIDTVGLKAYCKDRGIPLMKMTPRTIKAPEINDSIMAAKAKEDLANQTYFMIVNSSPTYVRVVIGSSAVNRTKIVPAGASVEEHARNGEQICLNALKPESSCITINPSVKVVTVKEDGKSIE